MIATVRIGRGREAPGRHEPHARNALLAGIRRVAPYAAILHAKTTARVRALVEQIERTFATDGRHHALQKIAEMLHQLVPDVAGVEIGEALAHAPGEQRPRALVAGAASLVIAPATFAVWGDWFNVDVSGNLARGDVHFGSVSRVLFDWAEPGTGTFLDLIAEEVDSVVLNGERLDASCIGPARVQLENLRATNEVVVTAAVGPALPMLVDAEDPPRRVSFGRGSTSAIHRRTVFLSLYIRR